MHKEQLYEVGQLLVTAAGPEQEWEAAKKLAVVLNQFSLPDEQPFATQFVHEVKLKGGFALSPQHAILCVDEYIRTARFVRGVYLAIRELQSRFPNEVINILYAGCGPYATLLLPVLPLFSEKELQVVLLDINAYSTHHVKQLLAEFGLQDYITNIITGNAIGYQHPLSDPLHLVVTETMDKALTREPQVAISCHLAPQITKNGLLIPEEISIDLAYAFFSKLPYFHLNEERHSFSLAKFNAMHTPLGNLLSLSKNEVLSSTNGTSFQVLSDWYPVPEHFEAYPDICLLTTVHVFGDIQLHSAESTITNPFCIGSLYNCSPASLFQLEYDCSDTPQWIIHSKEQ
jgi:hypothetical protein